MLRCGSPGVRCTGNSERHPANASDRVTVRNFQREALRELKKIKIAWPEFELFDGSGSADPLALDADNRTAQSSPARPLVSPFSAQGGP